MTIFVGLQMNFVHLCRAPGVNKTVCLVVELCCEVVVPVTNTELFFSSSFLFFGKSAKISLTQWWSMIHCARYALVANTVLMSLSFPSVVAGNMPHSSIIKAPMKDATIQYWLSPNE